jgi:hypothetical protein
MDVARHVLRRVVVAGLGQRVGQAGVGVGAHVAVGDARQLSHVLAQFFRAQRAVEADRQRLGMCQRVVERFGDLAGQGAAGGIGDGARDHDRQRTGALLEHLLYREDGGLGVQRIEDGLDQDQVGAPVHQAARGFGVVRHQLVEADVACGRVVDVGRDGRRLVGRAEYAGDEARLVGGGEFVAGLARDARPGHVELVAQRLHAIGMQCGCIRAKGVGLDDVGTRLQVFAVDALDDLGLGEHQQVVVALEVLVPVLEAFAAVVGFAQLVALDHGAHRTVEDQDALLQEFFDGVLLHVVNGSGNEREF